MCLGMSGKKFDITEFSAFIGLLLLACVFKSCNEYTKSMWDAGKGRAIFRTTVSLQRFFDTSRVLRFVDRETRSCWRQRDKFGATRDLRDIWVDVFPKFLITVHM